MSDTVYIYALESPEKKIPFYIGQTVNPKGRMTAHIGEAKRACVLGYSAHPKIYSMLHVILGERLVPKMRILGETCSEEADATELKLINQFELMGYPICNRESKAFGEFKGYASDGFMYGFKDIIIASDLRYLANGTMLKRIWEAAANQYEKLSFKYHDTIAFEPLAREASRCWKKAKKTSHHIPDDKGIYWDKLNSALVSHCGMSA